MNDSIIRGGGRRQPLLTGWSQMMDPFTSLNMGGVHSLNIIGSSFWINNFNKKFFI